ncbi:MAG: VanZ family protein [Planctomycetaceae bacterium]
MRALILVLFLFWAGTELLLGLPGAPYNVREVFGSAPRAGPILLLGGALVACVAAQVLLARFLAGRPQRLFALPAGVLAVGALAYTCVRLGVPDEALFDIVGSPVLDWPWEWELLGRFVALAALPQLALFAANHLIHARARAWPGLLVAAALAWAARTVVVPWARTDNVTELLGFEPALAALLLLVACNAALLARARKPLHALLLLALTFGLTYAGEALGRLGLAASIDKYGKVFSAQQFLLSPDREHYLDPAAIALRWRVAQFACVLLLALAHRPALPSPAPPPLPRASALPRLAAFYALFVLFGSLVPLRFRPLPLADALAAFAAIPWLSLELGHRADWAANLLLFVPLGFLARGALAGRRAAGLLVAAGAAAFSIALEFTQQFFPPRTVSLNDIAAETVGGLLGIALWRLFGPALARWTRDFLATRERPAFLVRLLAAYAAFFLMAQLLPLDLIASPWDLAEKARQGRISILPFAAGIDPWGLFADALLHLPIGALALLGGTRPGVRRGLVQALALGFGFVFAVELAQLFVWSRFADTSDLFPGMAGVAAGALLAERMSKRGAGAAALPLRWPPWAAFGWALLLLGAHWAPFDFLVDRAEVKRKLEALWQAPFASYYFKSEFMAFTLLARRLMFALPFGALLALALRRRPTVMRRVLLVGIAGTVYGAIEAGQFFLPGKVPDFTDIFAGLLFTALGAWIAGAWLARGSDHLPGETRNSTNSTSGER